MEATRTRVNIGALVLKGLSALLGFFFIGSGMTKVLRVESQVANFERWGYPDWFLPVTGATEILGAILLLVSLVVGRLATIGALLIACVMCGALFTRITNGESVSTIVPPIVLLLIALIVAWGRRSELLVRA